MVWTRQSIRLRPSWWLASYLGLVHGIAAAGVMATPLAFHMETPLLLLLTVSLVHALRRVLLRSPRAVVALTCDRDGAWLLELGDGQVLGAELRPGALIHPRLMILSFRGSQSGLNVVLTGDNVDADQVRRLRVRLRLSSTGDGALSRMR